MAGERVPSTAAPDGADGSAAHAALRESEEKYRALFDHLPMGFTLCRVIFEGGRPVDYVHEEANEEFEAQTGLRRADVLGRRITEVLPGLRGDSAGWIELLGNVAKTGKAIRYEHLVSDLGRWYEATAYRPKPGYFAVLFLDVTERRRALEAAREANVRLEQADRRKDEFLSAASHELRTPLATLRLQTQTLARLLTRGPPDEHRVQRKLRSIEIQLDRLDTLVNGLLDVSRVVAGRLELEREELDLAELAADVLERFEDAAERSGSEVVLRAEPVMGRWDRVRLEQVLTNLLHNALKFAPRRPVEVTVSGRDGQALLVIRDHGPGISPELRARLFGRFERAAESRTLGGLGLGLWISREIVAAHGGSISVESAAGAGSTFTVALPRRTT
jgi:signal transduction histidine kinase